jgi:hypothetical protein
VADTNFYLQNPAVQRGGVRKAQPLPARLPLPASSSTCLRSKAIQKQARHANIVRTERSIDSHFLSSSTRKCSHDKVESDDDNNDNDDDDNDHDNDDNFHPHQAFWREHGGNNATNGQVDDMADGYEDELEGVDGGEDEVEQDDNNGNSEDPHAEICRSYENTKLMAEVDHIVSSSNLFSYWLRY